MCLISSMKPMEIKNVYLYQVWNAKKGKFNYEKGILEQM